MAAIFSRIKVWVDQEVLTAADLNNEFNNILNNMNPSGINSASASVGDMQTSVDPGGLGSETLASNLLGEVQRLRFTIKRLSGQTQWYIDPGRNLGLGGLSLQAGDFSNANVIPGSALAVGSIPATAFANNAISTQTLNDGSVNSAKLSNLWKEYSPACLYYNAVSLGNNAPPTLSVVAKTTGHPIRVSLADLGGNAPFPNASVRLNGQWTYWTFNNTTSLNQTSSIQSGATTQAFTAITGQGFYIQSDKPFNTVNMVVSQVQSGSPVYEYAYWNGSAWVSVTPRLLPTYTALGATQLRYDNPTAWVVGSGTDANSGLLDPLRYTLRVRATTAPGQIVNFSGLSLTGETWQVQKLYPSSGNDVDLTATLKQNIPVTLIDTAGTTSSDGYSFIIQDKQPFDTATFNVTQAASTGSVVAQYWNGSAWTTITTSGFGSPTVPVFTATGSTSFSFGTVNGIPQDWLPGVGNIGGDPSKYTLRFQYNTSLGAGHATNVNVIVSSIVVNRTATIVSSGNSQSMVGVQGYPTYQGIYDSDGTAQPAPVVTLIMDLQVAFQRSSSPLFTTYTVVSTQDLKNSGVSMLVNGATTGSGSVISTNVPPSSFSAIDTGVTAGIWYYRAYLTATTSYVGPAPSGASYSYITAYNFFCYLQNVRLLVEEVL